MQWTRVLNLPVYPLGYEYGDLGELMNLVKCFVVIPHSLSSSWSLSFLGSEKMVQLLQCQQTCT